MTIFESNLQPSLFSRKPEEADIPDTIDLTSLEKDDIRYYDGGTTYMSYEFIHFPSDTGIPERYKWENIDVGIGGDEGAWLIGYDREELSKMEECHMRVCISPTYPRMNGPADRDTKYFTRNIILPSWLKYDTGRRIRELARR